MVLGLVLLPGGTVAQQKSYPTKPITILVGYAADGASDQGARAFAEAANKYLRQPIMVVNRPGESGSRAIAEALGATPDGYTLTWGTEGTLTVQPHRTKLPYGGPDTYVPVAKLTAVSNVLIVRAGAPWKTAEQFLNDARAHPGKLSVGVPEVATVAHLNVEQLQLLGKVRFRVVNFDAPQQVPAALGGKVDAAVAAFTAIASYVKEHKATALGVFGRRRWAVAPDVPTFKELGFDVTLPGSFGAIVAPRGTPAHIVATLNEAIKKAVAEPSFVSFAEMRGSTIDYKGPEALTRELRQEFKENGELIQVLGIAQK
jgi:tripartite-type tricarboxylate transporter receptor subunit TctC